MAATDAVKMTRGGAWLIEETDPVTVVTPEKQTDEHTLIGQTAAEFIDGEVLPVVDRLEQKDWALNRELLRKCGALGLLGTNVPEAYGGVDLDKVSTLIVSEQVARYASFGATFGAQANLTILPIYMFGTEAQRQKYLPGLIAGDIVGAYCLSESGSGSDALGAKARASRQADGSFVLTGEKMWITLADVADRFLVFAKTDPERGAGGISAFILERGWKGLTTGTIEGKMGVHASNTGWINMAEVRVPASHRLGEEGEGFKIAMSALDNARYGVAAGAVGIIKACLDESIAYGRERRTFGKPIVEYQLVQPMLAHMQQSIDAGELLVWKAGWLKNQGIRNTRETSMAKWYCTEAARRAADDAVQIHGAYGYSDEYNVERHLRNTKSSVIYEGTSQIHTLMQAEYALGNRQTRAMRCELPAYDAAQWEAEG